MDEIIKIPSSLSYAASRASSRGCIDLCQNACETPIMLCGECTSQGCASQCSTALCDNQACSGFAMCGECTTGCQVSIQCTTGCQVNIQGSKPTAPTNFSAFGGKKVIVCSWSAASDANYYEIFCHLPGESSSSPWGTTTSTSYTITGLEHNTTYVVNVRGMNSYGNGPFAGAITVATSATPKPWSWTISNGEALTTDTQAAHTAVTSQGPTSNFHYKVWNDMCSKVAEVRTFAGLDAWDTVGCGLTLSATKMSSTDKELTAARFNSLKYAIGSQYPGGTGIEDVSSGDIVYGSYFTSLMKTLNDWIDSL